MTFFNHIIQRLVLQPIDQWLLNHPVAYWLVIHPSALVLASIALVLLLAGLLGAIAQLTENLWIRILRMPFQLIWTLGRGTVEISRVVMGQLPTPVLAALPEQKDVTRSPQQELNDLLGRLEQIKQEEAELMQQIKAIVQQQLSSDSH